MLGHMARRHHAVPSVRVLALFCVVLCPLLGYAPRAESYTLSAEEIAAIPNSFPSILVPPRSPALQPLFRQLAEEVNPVEIGKMVSELYRITELRVPIRVEECGRPDVLYLPRQRLISLCYEFFLEINQLLGKAPADWYVIDRTTRAVVVFVVLHEIGHALVHLLDLQVGPRAEDAVDQFAFLMMASVKKQDLALRIVQAPAAYFRGHSVQVDTPRGHDPKDVHSTSAARSREALCLLYGRHRDPALARQLGSAAPACIPHAAEVAATWNALLSPYCRVAGGLF